ncbi:MAG TPA: hypothetical protein PLV68_12725, partial [Ilumatobacteraceae bacterium]|nr:hypothetical protein [Ilumatobacteraceae bacterium]
DHRPRTAGEFGRLLQSIEAEMHLAVTPLDLAGESLAAARPIEVNPTDDSTRIRGVVSISPDAPAPTAPAPVAISGVPSAPGPVAPRPERERQGMLGVPSLDRTVHHPPPMALGGAEPGAAPRRARRGVMIAAALLAVVAAVVAIVVLSGDDGEDADARTAVPTESTGFSGTIVVAVAPDPVVDLSGSADGDGRFTYTWSAPADAPVGIQYQVSELVGNEWKFRPPQTDTTFTGDGSCVEVVSIVAGQISAPTKECVS